MKVCIEGHNFDTLKAKGKWDLYWIDMSSNQHTGCVYLSTTGIFYVYTPSQWANQHSWVISTAANILTDYNQYLTDDKKAEIAAAGNIEWE